MSKHSDAFNALSFEVRSICSGVIVETRINQLRIEKNRLKRRYLQSMKEINEHIKNLEKYLREEC